MARHILLVDDSDMMRRVLHAKILANLDDAVIFEAKGVEQATQLLGANTIHLIIYGWDIQDERGLKFCQGAGAGEYGVAIPFLFLIGDKKEHVAMANELVGNAYLSMPCSPEDLARSIDRLCHPAKLRQNKRYCINDTSAVIDQRQVRMEAAVMNVSAGGALCEFDLDPGFNGAYPVKMSMRFSGGQGQVTIEDLRAVATNMLVIARHDDLTPKRLRMGFQFVNLSDSARQAFASIFSQAEED